MAYMPYLRMARKKILHRDKGSAGTSTKLAPTRFLPRPLSGSAAAEITYQHYRGPVKDSLGHWLRQVQGRRGRPRQNTLHLCQMSDYAAWFTQATSDRALRAPHVGIIKASWKASNLSLGRYRPNQVVGAAAPMSDSISARAS